MSFHSEAIVPRIITKTNGGADASLLQRTTSAPYVSVFIDHFLNLPSENCGILKSLYLGFGLSISQIEKITDSEWKRTSILKALTENGISKTATPTCSKYGEMVVNGEIAPHPREQRVIKTMLAMREKGSSFDKIALHLNEKKIRSKLGSGWSHKTVRDIINREQKETTA